MIGWIFVYVSIELILGKAIDACSVPYAILICGCPLLHVAYPWVERTWTKIDPSFAGHADYQRQYAISNLIKALLLFFYVPAAIETLVNAVWFDEWNTRRVHNLSALYCIPDFVSLFRVARMARSTVVHHLFVVGFTILNFFVDYSTHSAARGVVVYACFSTFAYLVNAKLANRYMALPYRRFLTLAAPALYGLSLVCNWTYQILIVWKGLRVSPVKYAMYAVAVSCLVYDDVVLERWLIYNALKPVDDKKKL